MARPLDDDAAIEARSQHVGSLARRTKPTATVRGYRHAARPSTISALLPRCDAVRAINPERPGPGKYDRLVSPGQLDNYMDGARHSTPGIRPDADACGGDDAARPQAAADVVAYINTLNNEPRIDSSRGGMAHEQRNLTRPVRSHRGVAGRPDAAIASRRRRSCVIRWRAASKFPIARAVEVPPGRR